MKFLKFKGFSLAEVLITLGVIGVVAAMTLPTLIQNYQKQATVTQLKKAYSEFTQALQKAEAEHGLMETWDFKDFDSALDRAMYFGENYLFPHIKTIKRCMPSSNVCWSDDIKNINGNKISGIYMTNSQNTHISFTTVSGYSVYYWLHGSGTGMWYIVDVNGLKGPNKLGRDIFAFQANWGISSLKKGGYPAGMEYANIVSREKLINGDLSNSSSYNCKKLSDKTHSGAYCAAVIMLDGWKITDTYPW